MKKALALGIIFCSMFGLFSSVGVARAEGATWVDVSTIEFRGERYYDASPFDDVRRAEKFVDEDCGYSTITYAKDRRSAEGVIKTPDEFQGCSSAGDVENINISFSGNKAAFIIGYTQSPEEIIIYSGEGGDKGSPSSYNTYKKDSSGGNRYYFLNPDGSLSQAVWLDVGGNGLVTLSNTGVNSKIDDDLGDFLTSLSVKTNPSGVQPPGDPPGVGGSGGGQTSCEEKGGEMSWILCPMLRLTDDIIGFLDNQIVSFLTIPNSYFEGDSGQRLRETNKNLRSLGYAILIPIALVMVISTALGFEFVSAYTLKRALPRLIIAVLFMALSFDLLVFFVKFINDIGRGVTGLLTNSFGGGGGISLASLFDPSATEGAIATGGAVAGAGIAIFSTAALIASGGIGILFSYALVFIVVMFLVFLIFALRQMLIIALILLAPLAILSWIFPGNDKLWKSWWGTFSKLLFLFPVVAILIASGRIFASIVRDTGEASLLNTVLILTAYIVPYFLIPAALKTAGGAFATLTGMMNDRGRGLFDRQKKYRGEKRAESMQRFKKGDIGGSNFGARSIRRVGTGMNAGVRGRYGFGDVGKVARGNAMDVEPDEYAKMNQDFARRMVDEDTMAAVAYGLDAKKLGQLEHFAVKGADGKAMRDSDGNLVADDVKIQDVINRGQTIGKTQSARIAAAKQLARSGKVVANHEEAGQLIGSIAMGNGSLAKDLEGNMQYTWRGVGRNDVGRGSLVDTSGEVTGTSNLRESLKEMSTAELGKLKPLGAEGLFSDPGKLQAVLEDPKLSQTQREHIAGLLVSASSSPYINADQQGKIEKALNEIDPGAGLSPGQAGPPIPPVSAAAATVRAARARGRRMARDPGAEGAFMGEDN